MNKSARDKTPSNDQTRENLRSRLEAERKLRRTGGNNVSNEINYAPVTRGDKVPGFRKQQEYGAKMRIKP